MSSELAHLDQSPRYNSLVAIGAIANIGMRWSLEGSVANDPELTFPPLIDAS